MEQIGLQGVLDDKDFQAGVARMLDSYTRLTGQTKQTASQMSDTSWAMESLGTAIGDVGGVITRVLSVALTGAIAGFGALVAAAKMGLDSAMAWGAQLETFDRILGISGEEAAAYAGALNYVGMNAEDGITSFALLAKNIENTKDEMAQATETFNSGMADLVANNADAISRIADTWTQVQSDAAEKILRINEDLANKREQIEKNLQDSINERTLQNANRIADAQNKINVDATRDTEDAEKKKKRAIEDLNIDTQNKLANATSSAQKKSIEDAAALKLKAINLEAKRQIDDIATAKKRREDDLAEQKREMDRDLAQFKQLQKEKANEQIAQAERAATTQTETVNRELDKQNAKYIENLEKQQKAFENSQKKLRAALAKSTTSSPFEKALKQLHLTLKDVMDDSGKVDFAKILDALSKLPEGPERTRAITEIFGRGGTKFLEFVSLGISGIKEINGWMDKFGLNLSKTQVDALEHYGRSLDLLKLGMQGVATQIGLAVLPAAQQLVDYITKNIVPTLVSFAKDIGPKVTQVLKDMGDWFGKVADYVGKLADAFKTGGVNGLIGKFATDIATALENNWPTIQKQLDQWGKNFWNWLVAPQTGAIAQTAFKLDQFASAFESWSKDPKTQKTFNELGKNIASGILDGLTSAFNSKEVGAAAGKTIFDSLMNVRISIDSGLSSIGGSFASGVVTGILSHFTDPATAQRMGERVQHLFSALFNDLLSSGPFIGLIQFTADSVLEMLGNALELANPRNIIAALTAPFTTAMNWIVSLNWQSIGKWIADSLAAGIGQAAQGITDALTSPFSKGIDEIRNLLDLHSPSGLMRDIGMNMAAGLRMGWQMPQLPLTLTPAASPIYGSGGGGSSYSSSNTVNNYFNLTTNSLAPQSSITTDFGIMRSLASRS